MELYLKQWIDCVVDLYNKGREVITPVMILRKHMQGRAYSPAMKEDVRKHLPKIRDYLDKQGIPVHPVNTKWFEVNSNDILLRTLVKKEEQARLFTACKSRTEALRFPPGKDDIFYRSYFKHQFDTVAGNQQALLDRGVVALKNPNGIDRDWFQKKIDRLHQKTQIKSRELQDLIEGKKREPLQLTDCKPPQNGQENAR